MGKIRCLHFLSVLGIAARDLRARIGRRNLGIRDAPQRRLNGGKMHERYAYLVQE